MSCIRFNCGLVLALVLLNVSVNSQTDLVANDTMISGQWSAPPHNYVNRQQYINADDDVQRRHANLGINKNKEFTQSMTYQGNFNSTSKLRNNQFIEKDSNITSRSGYAPNPGYQGYAPSPVYQGYYGPYRPSPYPYPNTYYPPTYGNPCPQCTSVGGYNPEWANVLVVATFKSSKCDGPDMSDYSLQIIFGKDKFCSYFSMTDCSKLNIVVSKKGNNNDVNKIFVFWLVVEQVNGHRVVMLFGVITEGSLMGKFLFLRIIFEKVPLHSKCVNHVLGSSPTSAESAQVIIASLSTKEEVDAWLRYNNAYETFRNTPSKTVCQGDAVAA